MKPASKSEPEESRVLEARAGLARGWCFTPLRGKIPIQKGWTSRPDASQEDAERWASEGNIGLITGAASGVLVIDEDTAKGGSVAHLGLPETVTVNTGGGGRHYYFHHPVEGIGNSAGKLADNVDVRGDGGQVVFPGSVHPDTNQVYAWAPGLSPEDVGLAELPSEVLSVLQGKGKVHALADRHLDRACKTVVRAPVGTRNDTLNRQAFMLGGLVAAGQLEEHTVIDRLEEAARQCGLDDYEIRATVTRAVGDGRLNAASGDARPVVYVEGGELPKMADQAEEILLVDGAPPLYEWGSMLVRMGRAPAATVRAGFSDTHTGPLVLIPVEVQYLVDRLTRAAQWLKWDGRSNDYKKVDCPERVARTVLAREGFRSAPQLLGIVSAPTMRPDGSILSEPGFDERTGLFLDPGRTEFPPIPVEPTRVDALAAIAVLKEILSKFPWVAPSDQSAAVACILTALVRKSLRTAPMFLFRAPKMGSGKSLLADVVAMIVTGTPVQVMSQGKDEDETRKRVLALLIEGAEVVSIDNVERPLGDPVLCSVLTQERWKDRVLGFSKTATVSTATTWMATGNNLIVEGDLTTRVIPCDLDAGVEHPEERKFEVNLYEHVPKVRGRLAMAGLTILRAYHVAGRPDQGLSVFGRFEEWSDLVRSALVWAGEPDPNEGRKRLEYVDPVRRDLGRVMSCWYALFGREAVTASDVLRRLRAAERDGPVDLDEELRAVINDSQGGLDARRLGHWLDRHENRIEQGLRIVRTGTKQGAIRWRVEPVGESRESGEAIQPGA